MMRKIKRVKPRRNFLASFLLFIILFLGVGYSLLNETIQIEGTAEALVPHVIREFSHQTTTQGVHIIHTFNNAISNIGTAPSTSWEFAQVIPDDANNLECTNMECERINNTVYMSNTTENGVIEPEASINTVLSFRTSNPDYEPDPDPDPDPDPEDPIDLSEYIEISSEITSNVRSGSRRYITHEITIANTNEEHDTAWWEFHMNKNSDGTIDSLTGALYADAGSTYRIYNTVATAVIAAEDERVITLVIDIHHNRTWNLEFTNISAGD